MLDGSVGQHAPVGDAMSRVRLRIHGDAGMVEYFPEPKICPPSPVVPCR